MNEFALTLGATAAAGVATLLLLRRLPTLRLQLTALALFAVALPTTSILLSGLVMFRMHDELRIVFVSAGAAVTAIVAALALTRSISGRVDRLREAAHTLAAGHLGTRAAATGPAELAELGRSFNHMAESIQRLFDARRELVAAASHDLRTPIAAIDAMHEAIEDGLADAEHYLPALREQSRALRVLVDGLFELARLDADALALELRDERLDSLVRVSVRAFEAEARARRIRLEANVPAPLPPVRCAAEQIERVLANLIGNALAHTPAEGAVAVRAYAADATVHVTVEDDGEGLSAEALEKMFERFWRADRARSSRARSGLGLAIAKGLVEAHGGRIWAENRQEGGARVSFTLPVATA